MEDKLFKSPLNPSTKWNGILGVEPFCEPSTNKYSLSGDNIFGFEVEVEGIKESSFSEIQGWHWDLDGSLRNHGKEFISLPCVGTSVDALLNNLFSALPETASWHPRAGIHVHCNCLGLTVEQIQKILLAYYLLEPAFFNIAWPGRKHSVFCVPLTECLNILSYLTLHDADKGSIAKYSALNLLPLHTLGTLEFRHLQSTSDIETISLFVQLIDSLFTFGRGPENRESMLRLIASEPEDMVAVILKDRHAPFMQQGILQGHQIREQAKNFLTLYNQRDAWQVPHLDSQKDSLNNPPPLMSFDFYIGDEVIEEEFV